MSGDFFLDSPVPPKLDLTGANSQIYRPPRTTSATSSLFLSSPSAKNRKRARYGYDGSNREATAFDARILRESQATPVSELASPAPLVNTDYRLAGGGLDTPTESSMLRYEKCEYTDNGPELDYRPSRYRESAESIAMAEDSVFQTPGIGEGNKRKRGELPVEIHGGNTSENSWGRAVISLVGGVAGKVWDFCWSGAFRGFYAGGGRGYDLNDSPAARTPDVSFGQAAMQGPSNTPKSDREETPVLGQFPTNDATFSRSRRDELRNNWVIVTNGEDLAENSSSNGARKIARKNSVIHQVGSRRTARIQPKRASLTPSRVPNPFHQPQTPHSAYGSSPRVSSPMKAKESPVAVEAQRYAAKIRRKEREEDASMRRLNNQLKAMIKEGKEALGTKIEVDDSMDISDWD